ncbi:hypothetical protein M0P65_07775 [Candidatus Gracilibacteria bacterium]|jgi:hypothetical protein|nr:hypothetical protein [Candidatus Gracilibacteria bacterium]
MKAKATIIEKSKEIENFIIEPSCLYTYKLFKGLVILSANYLGSVECKGYYGTVVASDNPEFPIGLHNFFGVYGLIPFDGEIKLQNV